MMGNGWGMGLGDWIAMTIFWVGLLILIVWLLSESVRPGRREQHADRSRQETAEQVLDRRYAAGDIDETTYRRMRDTLCSTRTPPVSQT